MATPAPAPRADEAGLRRRVVSAAVLIPIAVGAVWLGHPWLTLLVAVAAGGMAREWGRLTGRLRSELDAVLWVGIAAGAVLIAAAWSMVAGILLGLVAITALGGVGGGRRIWTVLGLAWIVLPSIGLLWLRGDTLSGAATVLWLLTTVWAIDTAAYAAGKLIGGPKLAPAISPNKTWAGLCGGIAAGALVGSIAGALVSPPEIVDVALLGGVLAIVEQTGDIAESYAKRRFGAKDSGSLIPGHGGLLDRLDGMLAVTSVVVILTLAHGGSVLTWR